MMVEFFLIGNTDCYVTYRMKKYIGTMTVDKQIMKYVLSYGGKISNHYESATYRFIKGAIKRNIYPEYAYEGWG